MNRKVAGGLVAAAVLVAAFPVFAETTVSANTSVEVKASSSSNSAVISCVGAAVATRESTLGTAIAAHGQSVQAAYTARAAALAQAYANTSNDKVRIGVKVAWSNFSNSLKSSAKTWRTSQNSAWTLFRTAVKACKAPVTVTDSMNAGSEVSGQ